MFDREKEKEIRTLEMDTNAANKTHAQIESTISNLKGRQKQLENEAKGTLLFMVAHSY
jgi:predicted  nucleic acid-binding Zn-ribbon protein